VRGGPVKRFSPFGIIEKRFSKIKKFIIDNAVWSPLLYAP
jgi:hypothetical protein